MPQYIGLSSLFLLDFNRVTIAVADHKSFAEPELSSLIRNYARRNKLNFCGPELAGGGVGVVGDEHGLTVDQVIGTLIERKGPAVAGRQVFQMCWNQRSFMESGDVIRILRRSDT